MNEIPPDSAQLLVVFLKWLGLPGWIVFFVGIGFFCQDWYGRFRDVTWVARRAPSIITDAVGIALRRQPRAALTLGAAGILFGQALLLGLCLLVGGCLSMFTDLFRQSETPRFRVAVEAAAGEVWYDPGSLSYFVVIDAISVSYLVLCVFLLLRSYRHAFDDGWIKVAANVAASPVVLAIAPPLPLAVAQARDAGVGIQLVAFTLVPLLLWSAHLVAWRVCLRGSRVVVRSWNLLHS